MQLWRRQYPSKTAQALADRYGCPVRTAENWLSFVSTPSFEWLGVMLRVEGAGFWVAVMPNPPAHLVEAAQREQEARVERAFEEARAARDAFRSGR